MIKIRPDQIKTLERGGARQRFDALLTRFEEQYPERDDLATYIAEVVAFASSAGFRGMEEVGRVASIMLLNEEVLAEHPLSSALVAVLLDTERTGAERLAFIDKYILPRLTPDASADPKEP